MVVGKHCMRLQRRVNGTLYLIVSGGISQIKGKDQLVQSENIGYSSIKVVSIDEIIIQQKITVTII